MATEPTTLPYQYPPDLFAAVVDALVSLTRSKRDVLDFFSNCGVPAKDLTDIAEQHARDPQSLYKATIARTVLTRINAGPEDPYLRVRREVLRRIVQWDDFTTVWPNNVLAARGAVASVQQLVNVKDSFTRMQQERDAEAEERRAAGRAAVRQQEERRASFDDVCDRIRSLASSGMTPQKRGTLLEGVLNDLFAADGIAVREAFTVNGDDDEGVIEQIDGAIELDGRIYLVEMKWHSERLGVNEVSRHMVRLYSRADAGGIIISASGFSDPAIHTIRDALRDKCVVLTDLSEFVRLIETYGDLREFLKRKVQLATLDREPYEVGSA